MAKKTNFKCDYCGRGTELVGGDVIYPHRKDLARLKFYRCAPCDAYVGTHKGTVKPLGRVANATLRTLKQQAHVAFDPMWRDSKMSRSEAYIWLASKLGIPRKKCHIGMFDEATCERVIEVCNAEYFEDTRGACHAS